MFCVIDDLSLLNSGVVNPRDEIWSEGRRVPDNKKSCSVCGQQGHYQTTCVLPKVIL